MLKSGTVIDEPVKINTSAKYKYLQQNNQTDQRTVRAQYL